jgi:hypothetical protein
MKEFVCVIFLVYIKEPTGESINSLYVCYLQIHVRIILVFSVDIIA